MILKHNGKKIKVNVKRTIGFSDAYSIIEGVKESCFDDDGKYIASAQDLIWKRAILLTYTDLELPDDLYEVYDIIYENNFFESVKKKIDLNQYYAIKQATYDSIKDERDTYVKELKKDLEAVTGVLANAGAQMNEAAEAARVFNSDEMKALMAQLNASAKHAKRAAKDEELVTDIKDYVKRNRQE